LNERKIRTYPNLEIESRVIRECVCQITEARFKILMREHENELFSNKREARRETTAR
jgi:hypothetical protein